jgi:hypothetical protein
MQNQMKTKKSHNQTDITGTQSEIQGSNSFIHVVLLIAETNFKSLWQINLSN